MRLVILSLATALLASGLVACGGPVDKRQVDDMAERIASLEKKVEEIEKRPAAKPAATTAVEANSPEEKAATDLMQEIQKLQQAGDFLAAKEKLAELQSKYPTTRAAKASSRMSAELNIVGTDAKPLEVASWYQGKASLADSKATLLVFWEQWCPHCKREMPKMQPLAEKWQGKGLQVVGLTKVTKSATDEGVEAFIKENNIKIPMGKEKDGSMTEAYAVTGVPAAAIVKDGKVVWRGHPARLNDELIEKLVNG